MEPCVELRLEADGVNVQIEARMAPGQVIWTPEEAGRWMAGIVADVHQILLQRAVTGDTSPRRLVKSGWRSWERPEEMPSLLTRDEIAAMERPVPPMIETPEPPQTLLGLPLVTEEAPEVPPTGEEPELTAEAVGAALAAPPPPDLQAPETPRRPTPDVAKSRPGRAILKALTKSKEPLDTSGVKEKSGLSDYMTRKTLQELRDAGHIQEGWEEIGGRWGRKAIYSAK